MRCLIVVLFLACVLFLSISVDSAKGEDMSIQNGKTVSFDYTLTVEGEVVDSSTGRGPLEYVQGENKIIPGLEKQLTGLHVGDEKTIKVAPEEAYGVISQEAYKEVSKELLPKNVEPKPGMFLQVKSKTGDVIPVKISEVKDSSVIVDFNHPLAGKTLTFQVKIVSVK